MRVMGISGCAGTLGSEIAPCGATVALIRVVPYALGRLPWTAERCYKRGADVLADLPRGTVTFLFTDIAGSTALWERDRAAMREAVARQLTILQSLITAHHGVLYKTVGDGIQAAFASAEEALRAAVASQRALLAEDGGEPLGPLRVRMALHAGEAAPDDRGDYL